MSRTVAACLASIGLEPAALSSGGGDLTEEWSIIKRAYFKTALKAHPDKGGDAATFREVQSSFDALRALYDGADVTFLFSTSAAKPAAADAAFDPQSMPSWEYYAEAAKETVPMYRVERAKSGRSRCRAWGGAAADVFADDCIAKDALRVGWFNQETGTYVNWVHLTCWRCPTASGSACPIL